MSASISKEVIQGERYIWEVSLAPEDLVRDLALQTGLSFEITHALYTRGFLTKTDIQNFVIDSSQVIGDSRLLKSAEKAVDRIIKAIEKKEKILIAGDYDVDGITATSVVLLGLIPLGAEINFFLPVRKRDGYGLSISTVEKAAEAGYTVIITVDNGISAFAAAERASNLKIDLIITDHHKPHEQLPQAYAIIDPLQPECKFPSKNLAGVGVIFKIISLLYHHYNKELPPKIYELLLLGTIADVVPLLGENRHWVKYGLKMLNTKKSAAINKLFSNVKFEKTTVSSRDIAFLLTPQINALGRLDDPRDAVKFLISADTTITESVGNDLKQMNEKRKTIEQAVYRELEEQITANTIDIRQEPLIIAGSNQWETGIIGLVAGKLSHRYGKPTFLFHVNESNIAKGSCRSVPNLDLFKILDSCKELLLTFGGHAAAAGLSLEADKLPLLKKRLSQAILQEKSLEQLRPSIAVDCKLTLEDITPVLAHDITTLEPYGHQNPEITFLLERVALASPPTILKDAHVKINIIGNKSMKSVIFFQRPELYEWFLNQGDQPFDLIAQVKKNEWNGKISLELEGYDVKK